MEKRNFTLSAVEVRDASNDNSGKAAGYAAVFNSDSVDLGGFIERIAPGAFSRSLADAASGKVNIFALWSHDNALPLGSTGGSKKLTLSEDERGLAFELNTARFTPAQLDALEDGELRMSFGFAVRDQEWREDDDGSILRTLKDVDLLEVSFVINPAYPDTSAAKRSLDAWKEERAKPTLEESAVELTDTVTDELDRLLKRGLEATLRARGRL